jgi:hypothetical protein
MQICPRVQWSHGGVFKMSFKMSIVLIKKGQRQRTKGREYTISTFALGRDGWSEAHAIYRKEVHAGGWGLI